MFGLGALHAGVVVLGLLFSLQANCAELGAVIFGPEFTKSFNAPTEKEKKAQEEEAARAKLLDRANKESDPVLTEANYRNPSKADLSGLDRASAIAPNEAGYPMSKYTLLIAAGREDEALKALARSQQIYTAEGGAGDKFVGLDPRLRRANTAASFLKTEYSYLDPASPEAARVKTELCRQVNSFKNYPSTPNWDSWTDTKHWVEFKC